MWYHTCMRNLIIGDIHATYDKMRSAFDNAGFNPQTDNLYSTGDLCDRGEKPIETLGYLMTLPRFFPVAGNHDFWLYDAIRSKRPDPWWTDHNGGDTTWAALDNQTPEFIAELKTWLGAFPLVRFLDRYIIVHAGPFLFQEDDLRSCCGLDIESTWRPQDRYGGISMDPRAEILCWDREYIYEALGIREKWKRCEIEPVSTDRTIICGHTPLRNVIRSDRFHLTGIDTGGFTQDGRITVMDLDTNEFFQSS